MTSLAEYNDVLTVPMMEAWPVLVEALPDRSQLIGGTALAMRLHHRRSHDLDIVAPTRFDAAVLASRLDAAGDFKSFRRSTGMLFGVFNEVKVDIAYDAAWSQLHPPMDVAGLGVASLPDIMAGKLAALLDRSAMRDYFDIMCIEQQAGITLEEGLVLFSRKWGIDVAHPDMHSLVLRLGNLSGVAVDPVLQAAFGDGLLADIEAYFGARHLDLVGSFQQYQGPSTPGLGPT